MTTTNNKVFLFFLFCDRISLGSLSWPPTHSNTPASTCQQLYPVFLKKNTYL